MRRLGIVLIRVGIGLGLVVGLAGCGGDMPTPPEQAPEAPPDDPLAEEETAPEASPDTSQDSSEKDGPEPSEPAATAEPENGDERFARAKAILREQGCGSCHTIQARGLDFTGQVGPDLTHEGERGRSDAWLRKQLTDPTSIPDEEVVDGFEGMQSTMPSYGRRLSEEDLDTLVRFLQSLEGPAREADAAE